MIDLCPRTGTKCSYQVFLLIDSTVPSPWQTQGAGHSSEKYRNMAFLGNSNYVFNLPQPRYKLGPSGLHEQR